MAASAWQNSLRRAGCEMMVWIWVVNTIEGYRPIGVGIFARHTWLLEVRDERQLLFLGGRPAPGVAHPSGRPVR